MAAEREKPMPEAEVNAWLQKNLPKWRLEDGWIRRTYKTSGWKGTLMVINTVGHLGRSRLASPRYHGLLRLGRGAPNDA